MATGLAGGATAGAARWAGALGVLGAVGVVLVAVALARGRWAPTPLALLLLGTEYAARLEIVGARRDAAAPLFAAGLLLIGELVAWALELRGSAVVQPRVLAARTRLILGAAAGGLVAAALVMLAASVPVGRSIVVTGVGAAAAVAALLIVVLLALRRAA